MKIYTADEIRLVEEYENEHGIRFIDLMENAGAACARDIARFANEKFVDEVAPQDAVRACVVCGKGKNGGDGFVIARRLFEQGYAVKIVLANGYPKAPDAIEMYKKAQNLEIPIVNYSKGSSLAAGVIQASNIIIDCIFGIGFKGDIDEHLEEVFRCINTASGYKYSIDVPSGVNTDTGEIARLCVKADRTLAITTIKLAHVLRPANKYCGHVKVLEIGVSREALDSVKPSFLSFENDDINRVLPVRNEMAHKNDFGHVLCVAGSVNMPGAACLSSKASLIAGAGLVTVAFPKSAYPSLAAHAPEVMLLPVEETEDGMISEDALNKILKKLEKATVLVMGCGLGQSESVTKVVETLLFAAKCPIVLDADGLNAIAKNPNVLKEIEAPIVVTPHPGEMARLCNVSVEEVELSRVDVAKAFAEEYGVTVLLKGPATIVASKDTNTKFVNHTGNAGLAKGGSGDVLSGIIGGLLAQGLEPFDAASLGAYIHGYAGDFAAADNSKASMVASDLYNGIKKVYLKFGR